MLSIRKQQVDTLVEDLVAKFVRRMAEHVRNTYPEQAAAMTQEKLQAFVSDVIEQAETEGIDTEDEVQVYLDHALVLGQDFNTKYDWAAEALEDLELSGEEKIELLVENRPSELSGS